MRPALRARRGFTLLEMIISMTLMLAFLGMTSQLFRKQSESVSGSAGRLDAQQNTRFALSAMERELRMAGVGIADAQPLIVMAGNTAITFNADIASLDTGDVMSVYVNPDADSAGVDLLRTSSKITLPGTSKLYPDTNYTYNGTVPSNAETISYWISHDSTSSSANEYVLFRRANARPPRVIARGIIFNSTDTLFQYFQSDTGSLPIKAVPLAALPMIHTAAIHGGPADTAQSARTDSIKSVKVRLVSVFHDQRVTDPTKRDIYRRLESTIHLMNAGLVHHSSCGQPPLGVAPTATVTPVSLPTIPAPYVTIAWSASTDDGAGEKDVVRYALYRKLDPATDFDVPFASIPAGSSSYTFRDDDVVSGQKWTYGVVALDCSSNVSPMGATALKTIP
ncbi:MAG: prepilin-type N-terminal cleavage/methylation domain-containing protein [Gemmatimonadaceae bacterium]